MALDEEAISQVRDLFGIATGYRFEFKLFKRLVSLESGLRQSVPDYYFMEGSLFAPSL
jgi:hypothetical protein